MSESIQVGDRVEWQQREARWFGAVLLDAQTLTGMVQEVRQVAGGHSVPAPTGADLIAFVVTPDKQLLMPSMEELTKVKVQP